MKDEKATQNGTKMNEMKIEDEMMDEKNVQDERRKEDEMKDERKMEDETKNKKKMEDENMENEENMEDEMEMRDEKVKDEKKMEDEKEMKHEMKIGDEKKKKGEKRKMEDNPEMEMENKDKRKEYELKRIRLFQWKWLNAHPWLLITLVQKDTAEPVIVDKLYPREQPRDTLVQTMYCGVCSKHPSVASKDSEISKRSGTNNFKLEALKKHEASQSHKKCLEADRAITIQKPPKCTSAVSSYMKRMTKRWRRSLKQLSTLQP